MSIAISKVDRLKRDTPPPPKGGQRLQVYQLQLDLAKKYDCQAGFWPSGRIQVVHVDGKGGILRREIHTWEKFRNEFTLTQRDTRPVVYRAAGRTIGLDKLLAEARMLDAVITATGRIFK